MATISEGINWLKTLQQRHNELVQLRNANARSTTQSFNGAITTTSPDYDAKKLDRRITLLAREIRQCNDALKRTNAKTLLDAYEIREDVLGELEDTSKDAPIATN